MGKKAVSRLFYACSVVLTFILALITAGGALAGSIPPDRVALLPFIGLAIPVLLLLNLAAAIYWTARWRCWLFIPLSAIGCNWGYLSCVFQFPSSPESVGAERITLATYNANSFRWDSNGYTCKKIAESLKSLNADILCFQEFGINSTFTADSVKAALNHWPYSSIPYTKDSIPLLQLAVFSKYPIAKSRLITYPESKNCSMWCDLSINGKMIRVFNSHLQTTEVSRNRRKFEETLRQSKGKYTTEVAVAQLMNGLHRNFLLRAKQAETLQELINATPYPMLVCGDFNSLPSSYTYHIVKGSKLQDGFQTCGHGYMSTFRSFKHLLRIDYILHSKEITGVDYSSLDMEYSDHKAVIMSVVKD